MAAQFARLVPDPMTLDLPRFSGVFPFKFLQPYHSSFEVTNREDVTEENLMKQLAEQRSVNI